MNKAIKVLSPILGVGLIVVFIFAYFGPTKGDLKAVGVKERRAIRAIQLSYAPSEQLMRLNPDPKTGLWFALPSNSCPSDYTECWSVVYRVDVMPAAHKTRIECEWVIDPKTLKHETKNTEARIMFYPCLNC